MEQTHNVTAGKVVQYQRRDALLQLGRLCRLSDLQHLSFKLCELVLVEGQKTHIGSIDN